LLGSCASAGGPEKVTVEFENGVQGGFRRFLAVEAPSVTEYAPEAYDLRLESDRPAGMMIGSNGTRNLALVGTGTERAFLTLARSPGSWNIAALGKAAELAGIQPGTEPADYWTPGQHIVAAGTILAVRGNQSDPAPERDVGALIYVRSVEGKDRMVLLIARESQTNR